MHVEAIVLAGGLGTRLRSVVSNVPKPMAPVNGRPFLERLLEYWIGQGVHRFVISVGYLADRITGHFGSRWHGAQICCVAEPEPLGTGGALLLAASRAQGPDVLVLNGDSFFAVDMAELTAFHRVHEADWTLSLFRSTHVKRYLGLSVASDGRVQGISQKADAEALVNGGVYLVGLAALGRLPWRAGQRASLEADVLPHALAAGWRIFARAFASTFVDIGVPEDYRRAAQLLGP